MYRACRALRSYFLPKLLVSVSKEVFKRGSESPASERIISIELSSCGCVLPTSRSARMLWYTCRRRKTMKHRKVLSPHQPRFEQNSILMGFPGSQYFVWMGNTGLGWPSAIAGSFSFKDWSSALTLVIFYFEMKDLALKLSVFPFVLFVQF